MSNIILILGYGENIGTGIAQRFASGGYRVAAASRSLIDGITSDGQRNIRADFSDPNAVSKVFHTVERHFGKPPSVVVYNIAHRLTTPPDDPLDASLEDLAASRTPGLDSAHVAAQEALRGFKSLSPDTPTCFIYTGNALSQIAIPGVLPFALAKVAAAMMIEYAANAYGHLGFRFYFANERKPEDGRPAALERSATAHANMYWELAHEQRQSKWQVTFSQNNGGVVRRDFGGVDFDGRTRRDYDRRSGRVADRT